MRRKVLRELVSCALYRSYSRRSVSTVQASFTSAPGVPGHPRGSPGGAPGVPRESPADRPPARRTINLLGTVILSGRWAENYGARAIPSIIRPWKRVAGRSDTAPPPRPAEGVMGGWGGGIQNSQKFDVCGLKSARPSKCIIRILSNCVARAWSRHIHHDVITLSGSNNLCQAFYACKNLMAQFWGACFILYFYGRLVMKITVYNTLR